MTPLQQHVAKWKQGCGSCLCDRASRVVIGRGAIPCDLLFVGEAPGESEDTIGIPFCGPAGQLLDRVIRKALAMKDWCATCYKLKQYKIIEACADETCERGHKETRPITHALTNLVGCIPRDGNDKGEPPADAIKQCSPRLVEFMQLAKPKIIVAVGKHAATWIPMLTTKKFIGYRELVEITHPAAILRAPMASQSIAEQRCVVKIIDALTSL